MIENVLSEIEVAKRYPDVTFGSGVCIGQNVVIGAGSILSSGVKIYPQTKIGQNVQILENSVIGRPTIVPDVGGLVKRKMDEDIGGTSIGDSSIIGACVVLYRGSVLGQRNIICDLTSIREKCVLADDILLGRGVMVQVNTHIGARTKIMDQCHLPGDMVIEEDVFLSTQVCGASENSLGRFDSTGKWNGPYIKKGAYIGVNATLLPGVTIGENSVVGAGALVTKDVSDKTLVMGVPAKFVRIVEAKI